MGKKMTGACIPMLVRLHMNNMTLEAVLNVICTSVEAVQAWDRIIANVHILLADGYKKKIILRCFVLFCHNIDKTNIYLLNTTMYLKVRK
jgi:hypothetical protein